MIEAALWEVADTDYGSERQRAVEPWRRAFEESGDARYWFVAQAFEAIAAEFREHDRVPESWFQPVWLALRGALPRIRDASEPRAGVLMAESLLNEVNDLLSRPWPRVTP
jgi:hypothetical protein